MDQIVDRQEAMETIFFRFMDHPILIEAHSFPRKVKMFIQDLIDDPERIMRLYLSDQVSFLLDHLDQYEIASCLLDTVLLKLFPSWQFTVLTYHPSNLFCLWQPVPD